MPIYMIWRIYRTAFRVLVWVIRKVITWAQLKPPNNVKMTKMHYEWLAWSIRQVYERSHSWVLEYSSAKFDLKDLAEKWADECEGTNPAFNRDRFISAVVNGEW